MCYCKTSGGDLSKSISDAGTKMPQLEANLTKNDSQNLVVDINMIEGARWRMEHSQKAREVEIQQAKER